MHGSDYYHIKKHFDWKQRCFYLLLLCTLLLPITTFGSTLSKLIFPEKINSTYISPTEDDEGLIWFNAPTGVYLFDGIDFTLILPTGTSASNFARSRIAISNKVLWFAKGSQLKRLDLLSGKTRQFTLDVDTSTGMVLTSLQVDDNNTLWIGFANRRHSDNNPVSGALFRLQPNAKIIEKVVINTTCMQVTDMAIDHEGTVIVATCDGLFKHNSHTNTFTRQLIDPTGGQSINNIQILEDLQVISTTKNIFILNHQNGIYQPLPCQLAPNSYLATIYNQTTIGVLTNNSTIHCDLRSAKILLIDDNLNTYYRGKSELVWNRQPAGLFYQNGEFPLLKIQRKTHSPDNQLPSNYVIRVFEDSKKRLWIGTGNGLNLLSPQGKVLQSFNANDSDPNSLHSSRVWAITESSNGDIYIGTTKGINRFNESTNDFTNRQNQPQWPLAKVKGEIWDLVEDAKGNLWIASWKEGLYRFNKHSGQLHHYINDKNNTNSISHNAVRSLHIDDKNQLWIGTQRGLNRYQAQTDDFYRFSDLEKDSILDMDNDSQGRLLIGTENNFARLNTARNRFEKIFKPGEFTKSVFAITHDQYNNIWFASTNSLYAYHEHSNTVSSVKLEDTHFITGAKAVASDGTIYFGSVNGLVSFSPRQLKAITDPAKVIFTKVKSQNPQAEALLPTRFGYASNNALVLPPGEKGFTVKMAAVNYTNPKAIRYQHRLLGYSDTFKTVSADEREVQFTNLDPGEYQFEVKTTDINGHWRDEITTLKVTRQAYFWQTYWFDWVKMAAALLVLWLLYRWRISILDKKALALEQLVTDRTQEIAEQKQNIESLLKIKEQLIANVSHEFRTPLTLIEGPAELLAIKAHEPEVVIRQSQVIKRNTQRLLRMVEHLLIFSKPQIPSQNIQPLAPDALLKLIIEPFELLAQKQQLSLSANLTETQAAIAIPAEPLEIIITNLLSNAIKYNRPGGTITIDSTIEQAHWQLKVSDTGIGIENQHLTQIFERFNRIGGAHHEQVSGAGLGLALAKELAESYQGSIAIQSELNIGSCFTVKFALVPSTPALIDEVKINQSKLALELSDAEQRQTTQLKQTDNDAKEWILVVEDNLDMCEYIQTALGDKYHFYIEHDGLKGLETARAEVPDIIISDVMMPNMDGFEFCAQVKQDEATCHIPVILLTALSTSKEKIKGFESLADEYLNKPFNRKELQARVQNLLTLRGLLQKQLSNPVVRKLKPEEQSPVSDKDLKFLDGVSEVISKNLSDSEFSAKNLYYAMAMSERLLQRKLKALTGQTPAERIRENRLSKASELLSQGHYVGEISDMVGFSSHAYFSSCFKARYGVTPSAFGK